MAATRESLIEINRAQQISETDEFTAERYQQMFRHFPTSATDVLDVGCNTGRGGSVLKGLDPELLIVGLDCVPERIASLDRKVYARALCSFSSQLPLDSETFDVIVAGEILEHIPPVEIDATLAEFFRVLRLHGRLILTTPNPNYLKNKLKGLSVLLDKSHVTQHYPDCLRRRLRAVGYSRVRIFGSGRMTRYVGQRFPLLQAYGSYLARADKW
jgi:ubiquinone/menaquinone biosynthesis C-methylase UbiE